MMGDDKVINLNCPNMSTFPEDEGEMKRNVYNWNYQHLRLD